MDLDYEQLARELVRALRGSRSQTAFARRLGYRSNAVYTWESGRRFPPATVFFRAAARVGIDVRAALRRFLRAEPAWLAEADLAEPRAVAAFLGELRGAAPLTEIAERAQRSRFAVARWLKGQADPRLPDLLRLVDALSLRGLDLVAAFVDPVELPAAAARWTQVQAARRLAWSTPWAQVVHLALELAPYQALPAHDSGWLAARVGLAVEAVDEALALLVAAGQARIEGGRYVPVEVGAVDVRAPQVGSRLKQFWAEVARDRLAAGAAGSFAYNVFTVSQADLAKLEELQRAHWRAIRSLVAGSGPAERVVLVQLHTLPLA